jgi:phosphoribosylformylglycinamidine synthase
MTAKIYITPKKDILDPQGKAISDALSLLGFDGVGAVRMGKYIEIDLDAACPDAGKKVDDMCKRLLANTVIESYRYELVPVEK